MEKPIGLRSQVRSQESDAYQEPRLSVWVKNQVGS